MKLTDRLRQRPEWEKLGPEQRAICLNTALGIPAEQSTLDDPIVGPLCKWLQAEMADEQKKREEARLAALEPKHNPQDFAILDPEQSDPRTGAYFLGATKGPQLPSEFTIPTGVGDGRLAEHTLEFFPEPRPGDHSPGAEACREYNRRVRNLLSDDPNVDKQGRLTGLGIEIL